MAFQYESSHERHVLDVARRNGEFVAYISTYPKHAGSGSGCDIVELGVFTTRELAQQVCAAAITAIQRATR